MKWEDLNGYQKAAFWTFIGIAGWFAPEIALLFHFGGIEVTFAVLAMYFMPVLRKIHAHYLMLKEQMALAYLSFQTSASAKPKVFLIQASFCTLAFICTGSFVFSAIFFMPGLIFNGLLI